MRSSVERDALCSAEIPIEAPNKNLDFKDKTINCFLWVMLPSLSRPVPPSHPSSRPVPPRPVSPHTLASLFGGPTSFKSMSLGPTFPGIAHRARDVDKLSVSNALFEIWWSQVQISIVPNPPRL